MTYTVTETALPGVLLLQPQIFRDSRGHFFEGFNRKKFLDASGIDVEFVQDNISRSARNVLRGLHYQVRQPQGKLVMPLQGSIFDVVVDLRRSSPQFGKSLGVRLEADAFQQIWVPAGLAHGFVVLSETADVLYKTTTYYAPQFERAILWNDPQLGIDWPIDTPPSLSPKDAQGVAFCDAELFD